MYFKMLAREDVAPRTVIRKMWGRSHVKMSGPYEFERIKYVIVKRNLAKHCRNLLRGNCWRGLNNEEK